MAEIQNRVASKRVRVLDGHTSNLINWKGDEMLDTTNNWGAVLVSSTILINLPEPVQEMFA
jgi:hypothetical protein